MSGPWYLGRASGYDWIARSTRMAIYLRDGFACVACGATGSLSLDHFDGRSNAPSNLVTLCVPCNSSRRESDADSWDAEYADLARIQLEKPIDRKLGLAIARERWPHRFDYARRRARAKLGQPRERDAQPTTH